MKFVLIRKFPPGIDYRSKIGYKQFPEELNWPESNPRSDNAQKTMAYPRQGKARTISAGAKLTGVTRAIDLESPAVQIGPQTCYRFW